MSELTPEDRSQVIPKVYKTADQLERAHLFLMKQLESVRDDHQQRARKWQEWDKAYRLIDEQRPDEGANIVDPEIQVIVDTLTANEVEAFLGQDPPFKFQGTEETDEDQAEIMTAYTSDSLRRIKLREKFERSIRQKKVFGSCIVKTPFVREMKKRIVKQKISEEIVKGKKKFKFQTKEVDFPFMDDTDWEAVSIFDFYPIGKGQSIQDLEGCVQIFKRKFDELKEREMRDEDGRTLGIYHNLSAVQPVKDDPLMVAEYWGKIPKSVVTGNEDDRFDKFEGVITAVINFEENASNKRNVQANHQTRTGEKQDTDGMTPITGGIRLQENPFWDNERPYLFCPETPVDNELYGVGIVEILVEKAQELNTSIRQVLDNKTLQLLMPTIEDVNAGVQRDLKLVKFPRIKANDINGIKPFPIQDFTNNGYKAILQIKDDMRRASGATEGVQGVPVKGEQSATEFAAVQQQAGVRIKGKIKLTDECLFKPFLERSYRHAQQFVTMAKMVRVVGKDGVKFKPVRPEDIWGTFDIITKGPTEIENNIVMSNKLIQYLSIAAKAPQFANIPFLLQEIWVKLGMPHSDKHKVVLAGANETEEDIQNEIEALSLGQATPVKPNQNHQLHIQLKTQAFQVILANNLNTPENTEAFRENIDGHAQMMATQGAQAQAIGGQEVFSGQSVGGLEAPNPVGEELGPSSNGTGASSSGVI